MRQPTVATVAKQLLVRAAQNLGIPDPMPDVSRVIDHSLSFPLGQRYNASDPLSPSFSETTPENLGFIIEPDGPGVTPADKIRTSTQAMQKIVHDRFGNDARHWLDGRLETVTSNGYQRGASYG